MQLESQRERSGETEVSRLLVNFSSTQLGLSQVQARSMVNLNLLHGWQRHKYLDCHLLPSKMHINLKLE